VLACPFLLQTAVTGYDSRTALWLQYAFREPPDGLFHRIEGSYDARDSI